MPDGITCLAFDEFGLCGGPHLVTYLVPDQRLGIHPPPDRCPYRRHLLDEIRLAAGALQKSELPVQGPPRTLEFFGLACSLINQRGFLKDPLASVHS